VASQILDRVQRAYDALILIHAAAHCATLGDTSFNRVELTEVIERQSLYASTELYWVKLLPAAVMSLPAPTDDEVLYPDGRVRKTKDINADAAREKIVFAQLEARVGGAR